MKIHFHLQSKHQKNDVVYTIIEAEDAISGYFDLTGRFPQRSIRGNQYLVVEYYYNANSILVIPINNCTATSMVNAWKELRNKYDLNEVETST